MDSKLMESKYKIRCSLLGHEQDVRAVCAAYFPTGGILSASRDLTARVWSPIDGDVSYQEGLVLSGHSGFVSSIAVLPPDDKYTQGIILTGSNDNTINAYTLDSPSPIYTLNGHEGNVCAIVTGKFGTVLSGSWDKTARVWLRQKCLFTLKGHEAAIWAVALMPEAGLMLTGSADHTIKMWKTGKCEKTFKGHEDCVRGLAVISAAEFLSCSNDTTVRRWLTSGECTAVYTGHSNYVYSIALMANGEDFVTCGEDRTLRVWHKGQCQQTIPHPTQSVWSVCVLDNNDIVTGSSDSVVRVFTRNVERMAPPEEQQIYEAMVESSTVPAQIGDISTDQLPGPDFLLNNGSRDGQTVMIRRGDKIEAHQWSAGDNQWMKIGDVLGGAGGGDQSKPSGGKITYGGKEYDYVFDIRLNEGPAMKLPFNITDDPWMAAHKFLDDNDLSQMYLDQVARYILDQTKGITLQSQAPAFSDPFTGGSRYVPGTNVNNGLPATGQQSSFYDPFTGSSRYVPGQTTGSDRGANNTSAKISYYPEKNYLLFDNANVQAMLGKINEFNSGVDEEIRLDNSFLASIPDIACGKSFSQGHLASFTAALRWPAGKIFPILDAIRLAVRHREANNLICATNNSLLINLLYLMTPDGLPTNRMLIARIASNAFHQEVGEDAMIRMCVEVVDRILRCHNASNDKNWPVAASTVLLNYAVAFRRKRDLFSEKSLANLVLTTAELLRVLTWNSEATFRLLVTLGTLNTADKAIRNYVKDLDTVVRRCIDTNDPSKATECAMALVKEI